MNLLTEVFNELLAIDVIALTGIEVCKQAISLKTLYAIGTEEVTHLTSRHPAVTVWSQVAEGLPNAAKLLRGELRDLPAHLAQLLFLSAGRTEAAVASGASAHV